MNVILTKLQHFVVDYYQRHRHPVNAFWHIIGVPLAFYGLYKIFTGNFLLGITCLFFGYFFQYLGHNAQGNEVGEITLIKKCYAFATKRKEQNSHKAQS